MAHLRINDDNVARFRQKPRGTIPQDVHAGQQPPGPPASDPHYDTTRDAVTANIDRHQAEVTAAHDQGGKPTVAPQSNEPFMHYGSVITPVAHPGSK